MGHKSAVKENSTKDKSTKRDMQNPFSPENKRPLITMLDKNPKKIMEELILKGLNLSKRPPLTIDVAVQEFGAILERVSTKPKKRKHGVAILKRWRQLLIRYQELINFMDRNGVSPKSRIYVITENKYLFMRSLYSEAINILNSLGSVKTAAHKKMEYYEKLKEQRIEYYNPFKEIMAKKFSFEEFAKKLTASVTMTATVWSAARSEIINKLSDVWQGMGNAAYILLIAVFMVTWEVSKVLIRAYGWKKTLNIQKWFLKNVEKIDRWEQEKVDQKIALYRVHVMEMCVKYGFWEELATVITEDSPKQFSKAIEQRDMATVLKYLRDARANILNRSRKHNILFVFFDTLKKALKRNKKIDTDEIAEDSWDKSHEIDGVIAVER